MWRRAAALVPALAVLCAGEAGAADPAPTSGARMEIVSAQGRVGEGLVVRVRDRFGLGGILGQVCAAPPRARARCRRVSLRRGRMHGHVRFLAQRPGPWRVSVRGSRQRTVVVRRRGGPFRVLATGDSMIQVVDAHLGRALRARRGSVRSDAHISTGITKPFLMDWLAHARGSAGSVKPDVTVVFLGANDGFPLDGAACCSGRWIEGYARRAGAMMRAYLRGGRGRVLWLLLPTPRRANFARVFRGVNAGVVRAARGFRDDEVRVIDLRRVRGRQSDGIHLDGTGARVAASLIVRELRRDGFIR